MKPYRRWSFTGDLSATHRLALANLLASPVRLVVTIAGIVFATFLMAFQGSLLFGFTMAASRIVDAVDADFWIVAKGTPTFDFVTPIESRFADLSLGVDGVAAAGHMASGWQQMRRPNGDRTFIYLIGVERAHRGLVPDVVTVAAERGRANSALVIDVTDRLALGVSEPGAAVEVGDRRATVEGVASGFSSFLGTPYAFTTYLEARRYLGFAPDRSTVVLLRASPGIDIESVRAALAHRLPEVDVWTKAQFAWRSRLFWLVQTGAGGALSLAALLGFLIGLVVVSQTIYALTSENIEEFATLKSMGASDGDIISIVTLQSMTCGLIGGTVGLVLVEPFAIAARRIVTWVVVPFWMYVMVAALLAALCILAAIVAARPALSVEPGRVFRA